MRVQTQNNNNQEKTISSKKPKLKSAMSKCHLSASKFFCLNFFFLLFKVYLEEMCFQFVAEDVWTFCCPKVNGELVLQFSKQS